MLTIVNEKRQHVSLCNIGTLQFIVLGRIIKEARRDTNPYVQSLATGLHLNFRWRLDTYHRTFSLIKLSWAEVFMLETFICSWMICKTEDHKSRAALGEVLEALSAAFESILV